MRQVTSTKTYYYRERKLVPSETRKKLIYNIKNYFLAT